MRRARNAIRWCNCALADLSFAGTFHRHAAPHGYHEAIANRHAHAIAKPNRHSYPAALADFER